MDNVLDDDKELQSLLRQTESKIQQSNQLEPISTIQENKLQNLLECDKHLQQCETIMSRIELETRDMHEEDRQIIKQIIRARGIKLKQLQSDIKWQKNEIEYKSKYVSFSTSNLAEINDFKNDPTETEAMLIDYGRNLQQQDIEMLDRVIADVDSTKQVAVSTADSVQQQTNQIDRIHAALHETDDEINRAKRMLNRISRRILTDKLLWCFLILILIAIIIVILIEVGVVGTKHKLAAERLNP